MKGSKSSEFSESEYWNDLKIETDAGIYMTSGYSASTLCNEIKWEKEKNKNKRQTNLRASRSQNIRQLAADNTSKHFVSFSSANEMIAYRCMSWMETIACFGDISSPFFVFFPRFLQSYGDASREEPLRVFDLVASECNGKNDKANCGYLSLAPTLE